jgi:hypothetical protein
MVKTSVEWFLTFMKNLQFQFHKTNGNPGPVLEKNSTSGSGSR